MAGGGAPQNLFRSHVKLMKEFPLPDTLVAPLPRARSQLPITLFNLRPLHDILFASSPSPR